MEKFSSSKPISRVNPPDSKPYRNLVGRNSHIHFLGDVKLYEEHLALGVKALVAVNLVLRFDPLVSARPDPRSVGKQMEYVVLWTYTTDFNLTPVS